MHIHMSRKEKRGKNDCLAIFHSSPSLDIASRNQIRKYATGAAVTGNIRLSASVRLLASTRISPDAANSPSSPFICIHIAAISRTFARRRLPRVHHREKYSRPDFRPPIGNYFVAMPLCRALSIFCWLLNNRRTISRRGQGGRRKKFLDS